MSSQIERDERRLRQLTRASARWHDNRPHRVETRSRIDIFNERESMRNTVEALEVIRTPAFSDRRFILERQVGDGLEFDDTPPTPAAYAAGLPVARITTLPGSGIEPRGVGTGFLIAPGIVLTNNHVLLGPEYAREAGVNFRYEKLASGNRRGEIFELDPDRFFLTNEDLDYTLVAVKENSSQGMKLANYGLAPLIEAPGKILIGHHMQIIQHPSGGTKKYAIRENRLVALLEHFLHYTTDTLNGSSGSPVFNIHWEVVGLHHAPVGPMRGNRIITRTGAIFDPHTMADSAVEWIANEGIRASVIVASLRQALPTLPAEKAQILQGVLAKVADPIAVNPAEASMPPQTQQPTSSRGSEFNMSQNVFNFSGPVTINVGSSVATVAEKPKMPDTVADAGAAVLEGVSIDPDYASREGYNIAFLGRAHGLPALNTTNAANASQELKYHHFSVVMNKARRLAFVTAVNIDGARSRRPSRSGDAWFFDPRLPEEFQIGEFLYARNPLDRGHLVRRLDPAWGTTSVAKRANDDTFHFTNCSPQHANLNQRIWNDLEDYLLDNTDQGNTKLTVFTGPVFKDNDPLYRGVRLPRRFWKVAVMIDAQGDFLAAAFLQSQARMIDGLREADFLAEQVRTDQVLITDLEALIGMSFGLPPDADPLAGDMAPTESLHDIRVRVLRELTDIKLR